MQTTTKYYKVIFKASICILVAAVITTGSVFSYKKLKKYFFLDNFGIVENGSIYRSGQLLPFQLEKVISRYGIHTVIRLNNFQLSTAKLKEIQNIYARHHTKEIPLIMPGDGLGSFEQYDKAIEILSTPNNFPILVCCARGTYRTGGIIAAYRLVIQNWAFDKVIKEMQNYRFHHYPHRLKGKEHPLIPHLRKYLHSRREHILSSYHKIFRVIYLAQLYDRQIAIRKRIFCFSILSNITIESNWC